MQAEKKGGKVAVMLLSDDREMNGVEKACEMGMGIKLCKARFICPLPFHQHCLEGGMPLFHCQKGVGVGWGCV